MTRKCVALGEILLRLKAPGYERLFQSNSLEATFGGGEANALVSLANYGWGTEMLSAVPDHAIGAAAIDELRRHRVGADLIVRQSGRLGSYFLETGAAQRPASVIYDRAHSVFSELPVDAIDFDSAFAGADVFLVSGITPAISQSAADLAVAALEQAKQRGIETIVDFNYRSKLWKYGVEPPVVMDPMTHLADGIVAGIEDIQIMLGMHIDDDADEARPDRFRRWAAAVFDRYSNVQRVACSLRQSLSASHNRLGACMMGRDGFVCSKTYDITRIVDRVGAGDALVGALIHGLHALGDDQQAIEFAAAAGCLKHSIPGDFNRVSEAEVMALAGGDGNGRVLR